MSHFTTLFLVTQSGQKRSDGPTCFFSLEDIQVTLSTHLTQWILKREKLWPVILQFLKPYYQPSIDAETLFLLQAQALETYHRNLYNGGYMDKQVYESKLDELVQIIPSWVKSDHRKALISRLQYGYQYSLHKRLTLIWNRILSDNSQTLEERIGNRKDFIRKVTETRNYLTHRDGEPGKHVLTSIVDVTEYVVKMRTLLRLCFLQKWGSTHKRSILLATD